MLGLWLGAKDIAKEADEAVTKGEEEDKYRHNTSRLATSEQLNIISLPV